MSSQCLTSQTLWATNLCFSTSAGSWATLPSLTIPCQPLKMLPWSNSRATPSSQLLSFVFTFLSFLPYISWASSSTEWINYSPDGYATMTHYSLPENFIAACGCTSTSTNYPTAAMNQMAYGSSTSYGPACGQCFNITLLNSFLSNPPFYPNVTKSVVVKVTDLCPLSLSGWCNATTHGPNA